MKNATQQCSNHYLRFPIFSGESGCDDVTFKWQIGEALRPFNDDYYNVRLWMFPRTQFHLVKNEKSPSEYQLYRKMRTEKYGQVVFEDLIGEGVVYTCKPQWVAISLLFPKGEIYLRRYPWNSEADAQNPNFKATPKLRILPGFKSAKTQTPLENT